ncbi:outer membrane-stress sensor serine endopeptidase DegS [Vibrio sp. SS-MA-C1-2]|uniref:outer membrane-stress sensor serine endopeptidase DegS n=1 Tax=Vibrio sp. SS-MA-C1-2 TaxID=2908646 RepID=UPI001F4042DE|nr:outer membrane-stress sensor serine endopeptidase DegS [Vibrio sp. SS-MA-C1-2]UJF19093.1 outer membrane-stress sensor serine endopeptidase DegS [Vibrio sp. SS-MA-C1-2]
MWKYIIKTLIVGLIAAAILLFAFPSLRYSASKVTHTVEPILHRDSDKPLYLSLNYGVRRAAPAVVNIYSRRYSSSNSLKLTTEGLGSGVIMNSNGYILTNYHVIAQADQIIVALQDGRVSTAQLIGKDKITDLAVLKIQMDNLPVIPLNNDYQANIGDIVLAIGNPYNLGQTTTFGIISATGRNGLSFGQQDFLQTDAAINKGNSGGALVNTQGELVGINTASFQQTNNTETYGISFAIPFKLANKIMKLLIADGRVIRGYIGITGRDINPVMARVFDIQEVQGVIVSRVDPNGPAEKAGIKPQDILIKINGKTISGMHDGMDKVTELRPGTTAKLSLIRDGKMMEINVPIQEDPRR